MGEDQNTSEGKRTGLLSWLRPSGKDIRKQQREEGAKKHRQDMFTHTVETTPFPTETKKPFPVSKRVVMGPKPRQEQVEEVPKKDFSSTETAQERIHRLSKIPVEPTIKPRYFPDPEIEKKSSESVIEPVAPSPPKSESELPVEPDNLKKKGVI